MGIVFRHDAAAVAVPSNNANRKYGQQLVLQQQQQKYQAQQAGYERFFQLLRDSQQNQAQFVRDVRQNTMLERRDRAQNDFQAERDKRQDEFVLKRDQAQFAQQQQQREVERQQDAMQRAWEFKSQNIREAIKNKEFDPDTARRLQANLQAESELQTKAFDDPQRAEGMQKIEQEREALLQKRLPVKTEQQMFDEGVVVDNQTGLRFRRNRQGEFEPLPLPDQQMQPRNAQEYYRQNEDQFKKDFANKMKDMEEKVLLGEIKPDEAQDKAWEQMQAEYNFRQKALGTTPATSGTPLPAPPPVLAPGQPAPPSQIAPIPNHVGPTPAPQPIPNQVGPAPAPQPIPNYVPPQQPTDTMSANPWGEVIGVQPSMPPASAPQSTSTSIGQPDFAKLAEGADETDMVELNGIKDVYNRLPPEGQRAMNIILSDSVGIEQKIAAKNALMKMGIDLKKELSRRAAANVRDSRPALPNEFGIY